MLNLFISYFYSSDKYSEIVAVTAGAPALFNKSSSDDRPGPGICSCKYVEDAKAALNVEGRGPEVALVRTCRPRH